VPAQGRIGGTVLDENDKPVPGAFVRLAALARPTRENEGGGLGTETDQEGRYEFGELPPGIYRVSINADSGPSPGEPYQGGFARTAAGEVTFALRSGQSIALEPVRVRRVSKVRVPVILRNAAGAPVPGAEVKLWLILQNGKREPVWPQAVSDVDGRFEIELWKDQSYSMTVGTPMPYAWIEFMATGQLVTLTVVPR
jgi:uncharacterized GH25 family protein